MSATETQEPINWDAVPFGTKPDAKIAVDLGVTREAVRMQRKARNIAVFAPESKPKKQKVSRAEAARRGGSAVTHKKIRASRENGRKSRGPGTVSEATRESIRAAQKRRWARVKATEREALLVRSSG